MLCVRNPELPAGTGPPGGASLHVLGREVLDSSGVCGSSQGCLEGGGYRVL